MADYLLVISVSDMDYTDMIILERVIQAHFEKIDLEHFERCMNRAMRQCEVRKL